MYTRNETKIINIGGVQIGGGNPIAIQSMTNTKTHDVEATVNQILKLEEAGCEIVRVAVPDWAGCYELFQILQNAFIFHLLRIYILIID